MDGIRVAKSVNGVVQKFVADENRDYAQVIEERDLGGSVQVAYVYGDDLMSAEFVAAGLGQRFYQYDGQLSTRQLTDAAAQVTDSYTLDAFGVTMASSGTTPNNYLYTSEQHDPNLGSYYLRARYLDEDIGRFSSQDPFPGLEQDPVSFHRYLYANGNPAIFIDPSGLVSLPELLVGVAIIGLLIGFFVMTIFGSERREGESFWRCVGRQIEELLGATLTVVAAGTGSGILYSLFGPKSIDFDVLSKVGRNGKDVLLAVRMLIDFGKRGIVAITFNRAALAALGLGTVGKAAFAGEILSLAAANPVHVTIAFLVGFSLGIILGAMYNCK